MRSLFSLSHLNDQGLFRCQFHGDAPSLGRCERRLTGDFGNRNFSAQTKRLQVQSQSAEALGYGIVVEGEIDGVTSAEALTCNVFAFEGGKPYRLPARSRQLADQGHVPIEEWL